MPSHLAAYAGLLSAGPPNVLALDWPDASLLFQQGRAAFFIDASLFGPGFEVAPYRIQRNGNLSLVMSGETLMGPGAATRPMGMDDPWLLEAASHTANK